MLLGIKLKLRRTHNSRCARAVTSTLEDHSCQCTMEEVLCPTAQAAAIVRSSTPTRNASQTAAYEKRIDLWTKIAPGNTRRNFDDVKIGR